MFEGIAVLLLGCAIGAGLAWVFGRGTAAQEAGLQDRLDLTQRELNEARAQLATGQNEAIRLAERIAKAEAGNESLQRQLHELTIQLGTSQAAVDETRDAKEQTAAQLASIRAQLASTQAQLATVSSQHDVLKSAYEEMRTARDELAQRYSRLEAEKAAAEALVANREEARLQLVKDFELLAGRIFEEKTGRFSQDSQQAIDLLLRPLAEQLKAFEQKVERSYGEEQGQRLLLKQEIAKLAEANATISVEANNLTAALKGDTQFQGAWGEFILERLLESSGLRRGDEYRIQETFVNDDGDRSRPDVIIDLPEARHVVIDSKMSLTAYDRFCSSESEEARGANLAQHVASIRAHIRGLAEKDYHKLYGLKSPDFVLMFIGLESAFVCAMRSEPALVQEALQKNVLLVCPSTLLGTLRIIASMWRLEAQNKNTKEIVRQAGVLYDKFVGFVDDLKEVGARLEQAQSAFENAQGKLLTGRGNLVRTAERIRELGVTPSKSLAAPIVEAAVEQPELELVPSSTPRLK